jgi:hypothetical protein
VKLKATKEKYGIRGQYGRPSKAKRALSETGPFK